MVYYYYYCLMAELFRLNNKSEREIEFLKKALQIVKKKGEKEILLGKLAKALNIKV